MHEALRVASVAPQRRTWWCGCGHNSAAAAACKLANTRTVVSSCMVGAVLVVSTQLKLTAGRTAHGGLVLALTAGRVLLSNPCFEADAHLASAQGASVCVCPTSCITPGDQEIPL